MAETEIKDVTNEPINQVAAPAAVEQTPVATTPTPAVAEPTAVSKPKYGHFVVEAVLLVGLFLLGSSLANVKSDNKNLQTQLASVQNNPQALVQKQSNDLITKVGVLMKLPAGETPTVAAVSDAAAAKQQSPFFANAANGDKVLLYVKAGEAILYRPSTNKIILVAPLTFNSAQASATKQ